MTSARLLPRSCSTSMRAPGSSPCSWASPMGWGSHPLLTCLLSARVHSVWEACKPPLRRLFSASSVPALSPLWGRVAPSLSSGPPPLFNVKGSWPAADCCVSGPRFFDHTFLCDSDDEELAGIVELCHSPPPCSRAPRRHRTPLLSFVGKTAPTRKARTPAVADQGGQVQQKILGWYKKGDWATQTRH